MFIGIMKYKCSIKARVFFYALFNFFLIFRPVHGQDKLYPNEFPLADVKLLDGPFKHARDLNIKVLLEYDVDRLLQPFLKEAGLPGKGERYKNRAGVDGHVGGHYLSGLAMNYAATGNAVCKKRLGYMIRELKACREANTMNSADWGTGYVAGVPRPGCPGIMFIKSVQF
jgi:DUF1680 family protein